jgi:hypothetical protein
MLLHDTKHLVFKMAQLRKKLLESVGNHRKLSWERISAGATAIIAPAPTATLDAGRGAEE